MANELIKRLEYTAENGLFKAMKDGKPATYDDAIRALKAADEMAEALIGMSAHGYMGSDRATEALTAYRAALTQREVKP